MQIIGLDSFYRGVDTKDNDRMWCESMKETKKRKIIGVDVYIRTEYTDIPLRLTDHKHIFRIH